MVGELIDEPAKPLAPLSEVDQLVSRQRARKAMLKGSLLGVALGCSKNEMIRNVGRATVVGGVMIAGFKGVKAFMNWDPLADAQFPVKPSQGLPEPVRQLNDPRSAR